MRALLCLVALGACHSPQVAPAGGVGHGGTAGFGFDPTDAGAGERAGVGGAGGQSCAFQSFAAERLPLDLVVLVDASGSMADPVAGAGQSKWEMAQEALFSFVKDPGSAGLGLGLQFFPAVGAGSPCSSAADCGDPQASMCGQRQLCVSDGRSGGATCGPAMPVCPAGATCQTLGTCAMTGAPCINAGGACPGGDACRTEPTTCLATTPLCAPDRYAQLAVPIAELPAGAPALVRLLGMRRAGGVTPMSEAVVGTLTHLRARATAMPRRRAALVLATDGLPSGCSDRDIPLVGDAIWTARNTPPSVPTYVIGVLDAADLTGGKVALAELARAGGSGEPFILTPAGDLTQRLLAALARIRGDALPCEYAIPAGTGTIDFDRVNVAWRTSGAAENFLYVASAQRCDPARGGWYYDVEPTAGKPSRVILCPASCTRLKGDAAAQVELRFGCKTEVIE
jgi:hypothetical protein